MVQEKTGGLKFQNEKIGSINLFFLWKKKISIILFLIEEYLEQVGKQQYVLS